MQPLGKAALWVLSVFFLLFGLILIAIHPPAALMALLIGIVLLPPMVGFIDHPSYPLVRWIITGIAFALLIILTPPEDAQVQQVQTPTQTPLPTQASLSPSPSPSPSPSLSPQTLVQEPNNQPLEFEKYLRVSGGELGCDRITDSQGLQWHVGYLRVNEQEYSINGAGSQLGLIPPIDEVWKEEAFKTDPTGALDFQLRLEDAVENVCISEYPDTATRSDWQKQRQVLGLSPSNWANQPVSTPQTTPANLPTCATSDCNCKDFNTQAEAQAVFDAFASSGDIHRLDQNNDGVACESLP